MRLTCVQLSGFKSFVEPTTLNFPGNRTAIVGPNGCGKSNVIDAVRWVMGESSAKQLRGDAMTDVIFNGSTNRRAHGAASVELVFDNTDSRLSGQYAAVTSLAVKRRLSRDGENQFFINGEKCRRRDVTDLFSGTGLGPRAYAIIEQGTVARLIDAKPEDLRSFIEEAAGITKYKERRRETAQRIEHSRDNLARIHDITQEVQQNINRLSQQAQAAEQFRLLKQRIRTTQAQQKALQWRDLQNALADFEQQLQEFSQRNEQLLDEQLEIQQQQELLTEQQSVCLAQQDACNQQVLQLSQDIAQYLTHTAHHQAQLGLWQQQAKELAEELAELERTLTQIQAAAQTREAALTDYAQTLASTRTSRQAISTQQQLALEQQQLLAATLNAAQVHLQDLTGKLLLLTSQQQSLNSQIELAAHQLAERQQLVQQVQSSAEQPISEFSAGELSGESVQHELAQVKRQCDEREARRQKLLNEQAYWAGRLGRPGANQPTDESNWHSIDGPWTNTWAAAEPWLQPWIRARAWTGSWEEASAQVQAPAFLVKNDADTQGISAWLASWQPVANTQAALAALKAAPEGIFCTPQGEVFARDWLYLPAAGESRFDLHEHLEQLATLEQDLTDLNGELKQLHERQAELEALNTQQQQHQLRHQILQHYQQATLSTAQNELAQAHSHWQQLADASVTLESQRLQLENALNEQQAVLADIQTQIDIQKAHLAEWAGQEQALIVTADQLLSTIQFEQSATQAELPLTQRLTEQQQRLIAKQSGLRAQIDTGLQQDAPLNALQSELAQAQLQLQELKSQYSAGEKQLKHLTQQDKSLRQRHEQLRQKQETAKLAAQALTTEQQGLQGEAFDINTALAMLPAHIDSEQLQALLIADKIELEALGPVNLAALEEYEQASERAGYLLQQQTDLHQALECLENAMKQIDRETRQRFKQTFDAANEGLQELFPQVFAGGNAYLELIGDDLLAAGVAIMARPPGKKNSTIHLLSGGEKALTALALVFALFRLNPAPFCLLDEVDAPLDDANVGRFARLVETMAQQIQFIFITHNKIAMEMAEHLLGVTMQEPGVSRVVSVDIAYAAELAAD
ncbi:MAG TPA: AAA family ATPase [Cellvibrionaceae bacterium]